MVGDRGNRSFSEMAHSTGEDTHSPFELPMQPVPINRTDDRNTRYPSGGTSFNGGTTRSPFEIPVQGGQQQTQGGRGMPTDAGNNGGGSGTIYQRRPPVDPLNGQWRATPDVAPSARNLPPIDGQTPSYTGQPNGGWRATPDVAPGARTLPPMDGQQQGYPPQQGDPGRWQPSPNQVPGMDGNGRYTPAGGDTTYNPGGQRVGSDPVATTGNGGMGQASDAQRDAVNNSLHTQLNYRWHFAEAALGGLAGSSVIPWAADKLMYQKWAETTPVVRNIGDWWKNNHSPRMFEHEAAMADAVELRARTGLSEAARADIEPALKGKYDADLAYETARKSGDLTAIETARQDVLKQQQALAAAEAKHATELQTLKDAAVKDAERSLTRQLIDSRTQAQAARDAVWGTRSTATTPGSGYMELVEMTRKAQQELKGVAAGTDPAVVERLQQRAAFFQDVVVDSRKTLGTGSTVQTLRDRISAHEAAKVITMDESRKLTSQLDRFETMQTANRAVSTAEAELLQNGTRIADAKAAADLVLERGGNFKWHGRENTWQRTTQAPEGPIPAAGEPKLGVMEKEFGTWRGDNKWRAAGEGVAVAATGLAVNYAIDKFMPNMFGLVGGKDAHPGDHWRSYLQGPAIATALLVPNKNFVWRLGATALSVGLITTAEHFFPEKPNSTYSTLMKPNFMDSFGMGAAWMLPFTNWKSRAMAVGGAWAIGRGLNVIDSTFGTHITGTDHNFAVGMNDDVASSLMSKKVTTSSFDDIRSSSVKLGMENEGALIVQQGDFMNAKDHDPLYHLHGSAALYTAWGDVYMQRGTKIDPTKMNADGRILAGMNYDLGGQAADFYRQSIANLVEGQNQAARVGNKDQQDAMAKSQREVMERLDSIYGDHDVRAVFNKLKDEYRQNIDSLPRFQVSLKQKVDSLQTRDTKYAAKMCRDLALLDLAIASYKADHNEGGGAQIMYAEALKYLQAAERIQGDSNDAKAMRQIANDLSGKVPQAVNNQYNNGFNNPFGVK